MVDGFFSDLQVVLYKYLGTSQERSWTHLADVVSGSHTECLARKKKPKNRVQLGVTCVAGYMSGVAGAIGTNSADYMITIINNRKGISYVQAAKRIGVVGLFTRSLLLGVMLVGPLVTAQWFCYDTVKVVVGLPTSGGVEHLIEGQDIE